MEEISQKSKVYQIKLYKITIHDMQQASSYLGSVLGMERFDRIKMLLANIRKSGIKFSFIACSGVSGIVPSSTIAHILKKDLLIVRKNGEQSHGQKIEYFGSETPNGYIIIDDYIITGETVNNIISRVNKWFHGITDCKGIFLTACFGGNKFPLRKKKCYQYYPVF